MAAKKKMADGSSADSFVWPFGRKNYILLGISLAVIILGYIFLGYGDDPDNMVSLTLAPIVLVIGYAMIPFAILARDKAYEDGVDGKRQSDAGTSEQA